MSALTVMDLAPEIASIAARHMSSSIGRQVLVVMIALDVLDGHNDIAVGAHNVSREGLIDTLEGLLGALRSGECVTQVRVNGEAVAQHEGKPS